MVLLDFTSLTTQHYQAAKCTEIKLSTNTNTNTTNPNHNETTTLPSKSKIACVHDTHTNTAEHEQEQDESSSIVISSSRSSHPDWNTSSRASVIQREWEDLQLRQFQEDVWCDMQRRREAEDVAERLLEDAMVFSHEHHQYQYAYAHGKENVQSKSEDYRYHGLTLDDWENEIRWDGVDSDSARSTTPVSSQVAAQARAMVPVTSSSSSSSSGIKKKKLSISEMVEGILRQPTTSELESSQLLRGGVDDIYDWGISWDGADAKPGVNKALANRVGNLILDATYLGQSLSLLRKKQERPSSYADSRIFSERLQKELSNRSVSSTNVFVSTATPLNANKDELKRIIADKQKKRERLAKDKASRVIDAMKDLDLGPGKGRSVTSSLMGPGGTERTGRPTRQIVASSHYDTEVVDHLDIVYNHVFVRPDLRVSELRQFHRPRLFGHLVRANKPWYLQVKKASKSIGIEKIDDGAVLVSQSNAIRTKADLSPIDGNLVCFEFSEERPPLFLAKGMASKIINFYRGDTEKCPISAGGGDRPVKKKKAGRDGPSVDDAIKAEKPNLLSGPKAFDKNVKNMLGLAPKIKNKETSDTKKEKKESSILPEGVTEILQPNLYGPFLGPIEDGTTQSGIICNLYSAPIFHHKPQTSDFLMIINKRRSTDIGEGGVNVLLRDFPTSLYCVGQIEPKIKVSGPKTTGEKSFAQPFVIYQIAKALQRAEYEVEEQGMTFEEISDRIFQNTSMQANALRGRIKSVATYDKNTSIWRIKPIGMDDFAGVESLGRKIPPEGICAYESACAASRRLTDLGLRDLYTGSSYITTVGAAILYLKGSLRAAKSRYSSMNKRLNAAKSSKKKSNKLVYEKATEKLKDELVKLRRRYEVANFIYEELQLAPWNITSEYIEVHKGAQGSGMMKLTGIGDPSGRREAFSFLRQAEKPNKGMNTDGALNAQINKITGTDNDLRRLTMKQMADLLRSYGMADAEIKILKRWDRVHVIRDLATRAASDGNGDVDGRFFARGEKMKLSDQKEMYRQRIQEIWRRQRQALMKEPSDIATAGDIRADGGESDDDNDDDLSSDDDFAKDLEDEMMDVKKTNEILQEAGGTVRKSDKEMVSDARDLVVLKREMDEARAFEKGFSKDSVSGSLANIDYSDRKVVRRRITTTHADGTVVVIFKFIVSQAEAEKVKEARVATSEKSKKRGNKNSDGSFRTFGHAVFEDEDDVVASRRSVEFQVTRRSDGSISKRPYPPKAMPKSSSKAKVNLGMLNQRANQEKKNRKRQRAAEDKDIYSNARIRTGTSNRRERGAARDRMPHMKFADRLKEIQVQVEKRPHVAPFLRPVDRRQIPRYYEVISDPIDLSTIRDKNSRCEYRNADSFIDEFELMKNNAIKFNGPASFLAKEATAIFDFVRSAIEAERDEFNQLEDAVCEQLNGPRKKKSRKSGGNKKRQEKSSIATGSTASVVVNGIATTVNLGDLAGFDNESD